MSAHSVVHSTFTIERDYKAAPEKVFRAFADPAIKRRWFVEGEGWEILDYSLDFRVGGLESSRFRFQGGPEVRNDTIFQDIVPNVRVVVAYSMTVGDKRISSSLSTVQFERTATGTRCTYTEQGAYFDGADQPKSREEGCAELFDKLGEEVES